MLDFLALSACHHHLLIIIFWLDSLLLSRFILINLILNIPFFFRYPVLSSLLSFAYPLVTLQFFLLQLCSAHFLTHPAVFVLLSRPCFYSCSSHCILIITILQMLSLTLCQLLLPPSFPNPPSHVPTSAGSSPFSSYFSILPHFSLLIPPPLSISSAFSSPNTSPCGGPALSPH